MWRSYLRSRGSDSVAIQEISAIQFDEYREVNELILAGEKILPHIIVACANTTKAYDSVTISKAADSMLAMSEVEATFVIACNQSGTISISARSRSKVNVQRIMEQLGGGGHFNSGGFSNWGSRFDEYSSTIDWDYWKRSNYWKGECRMKVIFLADVKGKR